MSTGSPNEDGLAQPCLMARPTASTPSAPPAPPARHRSPAAPPARHRSLLPSPRQGWDSSYRGRISDFGFLPRSDFRLRFLPEKPITGPAPKVCQRCRPRSVADRVFFFTTHTPCRQSWAGHRIALVNPAVATGLLQPFLC